MIFVEVDGERIPIVIDEVSARESPHTGDRLRIIEGELRTGRRNLYEALIDGAGEPLSVISEDGQPAGEWQVEIPRHGSTTGDVRDEYHAQVRLEEVEELSVDRLVIDGDMVVEPYEYDEDANPSYEDEADGPVITADVKVLISDQDEDERFKRYLRDGPRYSTVVREGISDEPVEMRIGPPKWSEHDEGTKYYFALVSRGYDQAKGGPGIDLIDSRARNRIAKLEGVVSALLDLLEEKAIVSGEELDDVGRQADEELWDRKFQFRHEDDIDAVR